MGLKYIDDNTEEDIEGEPELIVQFKDKTYYFGNESTESILEESDILSGCLLND